MTHFYARKQKKIESRKSIKCDKFFVKIISKMPNKCWVVGCNSGYDGDTKYRRENNLPIPSIHKVTQARVEKWRPYVPKRQGKILQATDSICSLHFKPEDYEHSWTTVINGQPVETKKAAPTLREGAIPDQYPLPINPRRHRPPTKARPSPGSRKSSVQSSGSGRKRKASTALSQDLADPSDTKRQHVGPCESDGADVRAEPDTADTGGQLDVPAQQHLDADIHQPEMQEHQNENNSPSHNTDAQPSVPPLLEPSFQELLALTKNVQLPSLQWSLTTDNTNYIAYSKITVSRCGVATTEKSIVFIKDAKAIVCLNKKITPLYSNTTVHSADEISCLLQGVDCLKLCGGAELEPASVYAPDCTLVVATPRHRRCRNCDLYKRREKAKEAYNKKKKMPKKKVARRVRYFRTKAKLRHLEELINEMKDQNSNLEEKVVQNLLKNLPTAQQEAVRACLDCAKRKGPQGNRYTQEWVYHCLLMRIKSPALYKHMRQKQILALPSFATLRRYMKNLRPIYGFQESTFKVLGEKAQHMPKNQRRGMLSADEMKVTPDTKFNTDNLEVEGFVDLGDYTPESKKEELGDHGLVLMYRPFQGPWIQALACFLSKSNCPGDILAKILLEATILLERIGFMVDGIVTDGATWNRTMWRSFGLDPEKSENTCDHPCLDTTANRKFFFFSDFPHLIKCVRNFILKAEKFETPDGTVKLEHWRALAREEEKRGLGLRRCPKFSSLHLLVDNLLKMNVALAFQFLSNSVAAGMMSYKRDGVKDLQDCEPTVAFIKRFNELIDIMNSKSPKTAMWASHVHKKEKLVDFISYLDKWEAASKSPRGGAKFLSSLTFSGMKITLKSTIEIFEFLTIQCSFIYLMTDRLNQDCLENFFGSLRYNGGLDDHPPSTQFAQLFRLMSLYSLVQPPRGSNVTGGELLNSVITTKDVVCERREQNRSKLCDKLDDILTNDAQFTTLLTTPFSSEDMPTNTDVDQLAVGYISGYVARTAKQRWTRGCEQCYSTLTGDGNLADDILTVIKSYGFLTFPSQQLLNLIRPTEELIMHHLRGGLHKHVLFSIMDSMPELRASYVGCEHHHIQLTRDILYFYVTRRMYFACRFTRRNLKHNKKGSKGTTKSMRKTAKLVTTRRQSRVLKKKSKLV